MISSLEKAFLQFSCLFLSYIVLFALPSSAASAQIELDSNSQPVAVTLVKPVQVQPTVAVVPEPVHAIQPEPVAQPVVPVQSLPPVQEISPVAQPVVPVQQITPVVQPPQQVSPAVQEPEKATVVAPEPARQPEPVKQTSGKIERIKTTPVEEVAKPPVEKLPPKTTKIIIEPAKPVKEIAPVKELEPSKAAEKLPEPEKAQPIAKVVEEPKAVQPLVALMALVGGVANGLVTLIGGLFPLQTVADLNASDSNQSGTSVRKEAATAEDDPLFPLRRSGNSISSAFITGLELGRTTYIPFVETNSSATSGFMMSVWVNKGLFLPGDTLKIDVGIMNYGDPRTGDAYLIVDADPSNGTNYYFFNGESFTKSPYKFPLTVPSNFNESFPVVEYTIPDSLPRIEYEVLAAFTEPGTYDIIGIMSSTKFTVSNAGSDNHAPVIESVDDYPDPVRPGERVHFEAYWNDADSEKTKLLICNTNANNGTDCTDGAWCQTGNFVFGYYDYDNPHACGYTTSTSDSGTKNYYAFVCDERGLCSSSMSGTFTVSENHAPVIDSIEDFPDPVEAGEYIRFYAYWHDPDNSKTKLLICKTNSNNGTDCTGGAWCHADYDSHSPRTCDYFPPASDSGKKDYYAFVCDEEGFCSSSMSGSFTIIGNNAPVIDSVEDSPDPVKTGGMVTFEAYWHDADNDKTEMLICKTNAHDGAGCSAGSWCHAYPSTNSPSSCTYTTSESDSGTKNYYAFVCDDEGLCSSSKSGDFTISGSVNYAPVIEFVYDSPDPVEAGGEVVFGAYWNDYEDDWTKLLICKTNANNGTDCTDGAWCQTDYYNNHNPEQCSYRTSASDSGKKDYYAFVCQDEGLCSSSKSGDFTISISENHAPVIDSVDDHPDPVQVGETITFEVYWHDTETRQPQKIAGIDKTASQNDLIGGIGGAIGQVISNFAEGILNPSKPAPEKAVPLAGNDMTMIFICKTNSHNGAACSGGNWCQSGYSTNNPTSCGYETSESDSGTKNYYAFVCDDDGLCSSSKSGNFTVSAGSGNTPPNASFSVTPGSGTLDTTFQVDASDSSDNEDSTSELQVKWDWEDDGRWDTGYTTTKTASHSYSTEGTKTIRLEVMDTGGLTDQATRPVTVNEGNEPSCGDIAIHADDVTLDEGETVYREFYYENHSDEAFYVGDVDAGRTSSGCPFDLEATSSYDDSISAGGRGNYELRIEGQEVEEDESGRAYVKVKGHFSGGKDCSYDEIGEKRFTVYVNDSGSETHAPVIESVDDYPDPVDAGEGITFEVYWHDSETRGTEKMAVDKTAGQNDFIGSMIGLVSGFAGAVLNPNQPVPVKAEPLAGNDSTRTFICKTNSNDGTGCSSGTWCQTGSSTSSPSSCSYETSESDSGTKNYYAFVCDGEGLCSDSERGGFTVGGGEGLSVSISPEDPVVESGEKQQFTAEASGGSGSYSYEWELASYSGCETEGDSSRYFYVTCTNTGSAQISKAVLLTVTSGSYSKSTSTMLNINPTNHTCSHAHPCDVGEGDCTGDDDNCKSELKCAEDIGAVYGYSSTTDVCVEKFKEDMGEGTFEKSFTANSYSYVNGVKQATSATYRWLSHFDYKNTIKSFKNAPCADSYIKGLPEIPHWNFAIYPEGSSDEIFNLHVGQYKDLQGKQCQILYESVSHFCVKDLCGSDRKDPKEYIRHPPTPYPSGIQIPDWLADMAEKQKFVNEVFEAAYAGYFLWVIPVIFVTIFSEQMEYVCIYLGDMLFVIFSSVL